MLDYSTFLQQRQATAPAVGQVEQLGLLEEAA